MLVLEGLASGGSDLLLTSPGRSYILTCQTFYFSLTLRLSRPHHDLPTSPRNDSNILQLSFFYLFWKTESDVSRRVQAQSDNLVEVRDPGGLLIFILISSSEGYNDDVPLQKWSPDYFQYRFFPTPNNFKRRMPSYIQVRNIKIK